MKKRKIEKKSSISKNFYKPIDMIFIRQKREEMSSAFLLSGIRLWLCLFVCLLNYTQSISHSHANSLKHKLDKIAKTFLPLIAIGNPPHSHNGFQVNCTWNVTFTHNQYSSCQELVRCHPPRLCFFPSF